MSIKDLEQALLDAKYQGHPKTFVEAIAKMVDIPEAAVERVIFAWQTLRNRSYDQECSKAEEGEGLGDVLCTAIEDKMEGIALAISIYEAMQCNKKIHVKVRSMVSPDAINNICNGCPTSWECLRNQWSSPQACYEGAKDNSFYINMINMHRRPVTPLKVIGSKVTVQAEHPKGTYVVDLDDVL